MRIAIGELAHETNTFCPGPTEAAAFKEREWTHGDALLARHRGVRDYLGGMLAGAEARGIEIVPVFATHAEPSGTISARAYGEMRGELVGGLERAGAVDAICLALHGAGVAEGLDDIEGDILARVRAALGPSLPVVVTLDLHANVTNAMVHSATALLGVNEYPHVDEYDRGVEAVALAAGIVEGRVHPHMRLVTLPLLVSTTATRQSPVREINAKCRAWEERPGLLDCTFFHGFPHTDTPVVAASVVAIADGAAAPVAEEAAGDVARFAWGQREAFLKSAPRPA
jgi:microcystin degradation protein MlrC